MQDFFLPQTSFYQSQFVYLASYLLYPKTLRILKNEFSFFHLYLKRGVEGKGGGQDCQNVLPIATEFDII